MEGEPPPPPPPSPFDRIPEDILREILLRLDPQPSSLPRASAVSKGWRDITREAYFCRSFRLHHRRNPPLLGYLAVSEALFVFEPTLHAPNRVPDGCLTLVGPRYTLNGEQYGDDYRYRLAGSRHGLVLIIDCRLLCCVVWNPITGNQNYIPIPEDLQAEWFMDGAVLRDAGDDVHFRVVMVKLCKNSTQPHIEALARVYSSKTKLWGDSISIQRPVPHDVASSAVTYVECTTDVLCGESLYWQLAGTPCGLLEFNLKEETLSVIGGLPLEIETTCDFLVIRGEGGGLGLISSSDFTAKLWKRNTGCDGLASWVLGSTIQLDESFVLKGFAEENNVVFFGSTTGFFMLSLSSLKQDFMEYTSTSFAGICVPFESVYTAEARMNEPFYDCRSYFSDDDNYDYDYHEEASDPLGIPPVNRDTEVQPHMQDTNIKTVVPPEKQRSAQKLSRTPTTSSMTRSPFLYAHRLPLTRARAHSLSISTPESLKMKRTKSGRVVVPPLDQGSERIIYNRDGMISGVSPVSLKGSPARKRKRKGL